MTDFRCFLAPVIIMLAVYLGGPVAAHGQSSLYSDPTAAEPGDVLTVILDEQTSAQRQSTYEGNASTSFSGGGGASGPGLSSQFGADAQIQNETENANQTAQSGTLTGTITVRVVDVNEAGNLVVSGERNLTVNGATHVMKVSGIVRTDDVRHDNTVLSHKIADAKVKYNQSGALNSGFFSKNLLLKAGSALILGISIFLGLN